MAEQGREAGTGVSGGQDARPGVSSAPAQAAEQARSAAAGGDTRDLARAIFALAGSHERLAGAVDNEFRARREESRRHDIRLSAVETRVGELAVTVGRIDERLDGEHSPHRIDRDVAGVQVAQARTAAIVAGALSLIGGAGGVVALLAQLGGG